MAIEKRKQGRPPKALTIKFRDFCRGVINRPDVLKALTAEALINPTFALKLAEFGIGRPFQSIQIQGAVDVQHSIRTVELEDGSAAFAKATSIPDRSLN